MSTDRALADYVERFLSRQPAERHLASDQAGDEPPGTRPSSGTRSGRQEVGELWPPAGAVDPERA